MWAAASARNLARRLRRERARAAAAPESLVARAESLRRSLQTHAELDAWNKHHRHNMGAALAEAKSNGLPPELVEQARRDKRAGDWARHAPFTGLGAAGPAEVEGAVQYIVVPVERVKIVPHFIVVESSPPVELEMLESMEVSETKDVGEDAVVRSLEPAQPVKALGGGQVAAWEASASRCPSTPPDAGLEVQCMYVAQDHDSEADSKEFIDHSTEWPFSEAECVVSGQQLPMEELGTCAGDEEEAPCEEREVVAFDLEVAARQVLQSVGPIRTDQEFEDAACLTLEKVEPRIQSVEELIKLQNWACTIISSLTGYSVEDSPEHCG